MNRTDPRPSKNAERGIYMKRIAILAAACALTASPAVAFDLGDPVFPMDMDDKARASLVYESLERDLDGDSGAAATLEADIYLLRIHTDLGEYAYLDFDVGAIDPDGGDLSFYGGVGLRYLAYDGKDWRLSSVAQIHYAPDADAGDSDFDLIDGDLALLLSRKINIDEQLQVMPYAGPVLSLVRVDGDTGGDDFDADEDNLLGAAAGISLLMPGGNGLRIEARIFDEVSVSAAATMAF